MFKYNKSEELSKQKIKGWMICYHSYGDREIRGVYVDEDLAKAHWNRVSSKTYWTYEEITLNEDIYL